MSYFYYNGYYGNEMGLIVEEKSIHNGLRLDFGMISVPGRGGKVRSRRIAANRRTL